MGGSQKTILRAVPPPGSQSRQAGGALAELYKALKAVSFYPDGHPLCDETINVAYQAMVKLLANHEGTLVINRQGFTPNDGGIAVENNQMTQSLAREMFIRRILRLTFLADLAREDLKALLDLISMEPGKLDSAGGVARLMAERGIRTIWANEIDLSVILAKREAIETGGNTAADPADGVSQENITATGMVSAEETDYPLEELIALMENERNDSQYQDLARMLVARTEVLKSAGSIAPLLPVMEALLQQHQQQERSLMQREYAEFTLQQVADGVTTDYILKQLEQRDPSEHERFYPLLRVMGDKAVYGIIQRICLAEKLLTRKSLAAALVGIGEPAVPPLLAMLKDERWYVVRNMVSIVGELRKRDCVAALAAPLGHGDQRVRKETIRALMKIGGREAEAMIITLVNDADPAIVRHAVLSLGLMKSQLAVQALICILEKRDLFLREIAIKIEVLDALGRIGDRRATPFLLWLYSSGNLLAWRRREELRIAVAKTLGSLGDETAIPMLKAGARKGGRMGEACMEAIDAIERLAEEIHG